MPSYTNDELDDFEDDAQNPGIRNQLVALQVIAGIFEENSIVYAVMGGMNFYLRGSTRTTQDVDIAVDSRPRMDAVLDLFNTNPNIFRPHSRMQWLAGTARVFVQVQNTYVQFDLMPKGAEGPSIPGDLAGSIDTWSVPGALGVFKCNLMAIGPLVTAKIKAHNSRETAADYWDLQFVCKSPEYGPLVREASESIRQEWKETYLERVQQKNPEDESHIRWVLQMEKSTS